jgi:hypothetical protein
VSDFWEKMLRPEEYKQRKELERIQKQKENQELRDLIFRHIPDALEKPMKEPLGKPRIVTCPQGVVAYQLTPKTIGDGLSKLWDSLLSSKLVDDPKPHATDAKIREMYAANPSIDFRNYEEVLQIKVIRQERTRKSGNNIIIDVGDD